MPEAPARTLDVVFVMRSLGFLRFYREPLELLVDRGHEVQLLLERGEHRETEQQWLAAMAERRNFSYLVGDHYGGGHAAKRRSDLRKAIEYLRAVSDGSDRTTIRFRHRLRDAPRWARWVARAIPFSRPLRVVHAAAAALDRMLGVPKATREYLAGRRPDLVAVCDHGNVGSLASLYLACARAQGVPTAGCVASWDNLSSSQRLRTVPDALVVWNRWQLREAVELHDVPADRVAVVGAPGFDDWFVRAPHPRDEFLRRVGLDPSRPVILWVGGALYRGRRTEAEYALAWVDALRASSDPVLSTAGVLLRPHPLRLKHWQRVDVAGFDNVAVFPRDHGFPTDNEARADYFDSIYHCAAVVGVNTSAMIEAAILGKPVLAVVSDEWHDSQLGTHHFPYLVDSSGGVVRVSHSFEEQLGDLRQLLAGPDADVAGRSRRFVADFVRPLGIDRPVTPVFVETLEAVAERAPLNPGRGHSEG